MKKIIFTAFFCASIFSFANNSEEKKIINSSKIENKFSIVTLKNSKEKFEKQSNYPLTSVTCSVTVEGPNGSSITYTAEAGNWFSSLARAIERCKNKLAHLGHPNNFTIL